MEMEKEVKTNNGGSNNHHHNNNNRERLGSSADGLLRETRSASADFVLRWGNRKRLRCMKIQVKDSSTPPLRKTTTVPVDRRAVRSNDKDPTSSHPTAAAAHNSNHNGGAALLNLRQRPTSPPPPPSQRILRNSEAAMKGHTNCVRGGYSSPDRGGAQDKKGTTNHNANNENGGASGSSETAHDSKKGGSSSVSEAIPPVWPPKFVIALTNKEKEEDFMAIKGSKLPQRPKKRAKFIQRTLNLVSPGQWLCDLTLERYEVREKKISKKRPRGLKAMNNMDSDSE